MYFGLISKHFFTGHAHKNVLDTPSSVTIFSIQYETRSLSDFGWISLLAIGTNCCWLFARFVKMQGRTFIVGVSAKHACACTVKLCDVLKGKNALAMPARHVTQYLFDALSSSIAQTDVHHSLQIWEPPSWLQGCRLCQRWWWSSNLLVCGTLPLGVVLDVSKSLRASIFMGQAVQKERIVHIGNPIENDAGSHPYSVESSGSCWPWSNVFPLNCVPRWLGVHYV